MLIRSIFSPKDSSNEEPMRAHMPSWANNPDYTLHATSTKPDDEQRRAIFDVFDKSSSESKNKTTESTEMSQLKGGAASSKTGQPSTRL